MCRMLTMLMLFCVATTAYAEGGCPPGQIPYTATPAPGSAESIASCGPVPTDDPAAPSWESRWGAIATDGNGSFGIVAGMKNERKAKKAALAECQKRSGGECGSNFSYRNQCAAVINSRTQSFSQSAASIDEAKAIGQRRCNESGTGECWVYYSGCSLPVRVR